MTTDIEYYDWHGNPNERTPKKNRYSYDPYLIFQKEKEYELCVYTDRLVSNDREKFEELSQKYFKTTSHSWEGRSPDDIQSFLRDFYDKPELELVGVMAGIHLSSGYPYWIFMFNCDFES